MMDKNRKFQTTRSRNGDSGWSRRSFLGWAVLGWTATLASLMTAGAATARMMFPNVLFEPPSRFELDRPADLEPGEVNTQYKEADRIWLVRQDDRIYALLARCTHLGCTPNWLQEEQKFKCPCHGSGFFKSGINFEGPAPRPLERLAISVAPDGRIVVDKSRSFRFEQGQWSDPRSYIEVT